MRNREKTLQKGISQRWLKASFMADSAVANEPAVIKHDFVY